MKELTGLDAMALAELVRRREVKPIELVDDAIERIERVNPALNAVVTPMYDLARRAASEPLPEGPFTGVPFLMKDLMASYAGVRMTFGSRFLRDYVPDHDSELVARHKKAGLICLGKTNTPELGILPTTESHFLGAAHNPWDTNRSTGGSSGGSAAAVAAGIVPMAHANDGGGSIRIPASCCGIFGLKPTRARITLAPDYGDIQGGIVIEHAVTRSVRDSAALLDATAGPSIGDPYRAPPQTRPYVQEVGADPGRLRIGFLRGPATEGAPIDPECIAAVDDAVKLCADLGHQVEEASPTLDVGRLTQAFMVLWSSGGAQRVEGLSLLMGRKPEPDELEPLTWAIAEIGQSQTAATYLMAWTLLHKASREFAAFFVDYDLWLTPTLAEPPLPLGTLESTPENPLHGLFRSGPYAQFTPICNVAGNPAMSVPLYWNAAGLPIGVQFVAGFGEEATLFRLASQLEQARPWADRHPPVWAGTH